MRVVVVGAGIAGLAAALRLRDELGASAHITVVDQATRVGGKIFSQGYLESGAESFIVSDPAAVRLAERVGLGDALRHPVTGQAALAIQGELVPMPKGTLMGVPADPEAVAGVAAVAPEADHDGPLLGPGEDVSVGALVRSRLGEPVLDRLVDPLLGGVYAGRGDDLSLATTMPALAAACRTESTLTGAARAALAGRAGGGPVFATVEGGLTRLVDAVVAAAGVELRLGTAVRSLAWSGSWRVGDLTADAVVLAVPARPAARLLSAVRREAADLVGVLDYASVALVAMAVRGASLPALSGFLVPASEGYAVKALTIFTTKWGHLRPPSGVAWLRASVGRYGDTVALQRTDEDLATLVHTELGALLGKPLPAPEWVRVTRWGGALPQYGPGHLDRVAAARAALAGLPIALAGAAYDGVGIPACIRSGQSAVTRIGA
jgi:protoporphyrinogen/coproporphyrinogen III oxidase